MVDVAADRYLAQLAVEHELATAQDVARCLAQRDQLADAGKDVELGPLMVHHGVIDASALRRLSELQRQGRRALFCPACQATLITYGLPAGKTVRCRQCRKPLRPMPTAPVAAEDPSLVDSSARTRVEGPQTQQIDGAGPRRPPSSAIDPAATRDTAPHPRAVVEGGDPLIGVTLSGKYALTRRLGSGGMGAVYLAEHRALNRTCAIKVLSASLAGHTEMLERFRREARATAQLDHPNVVRVFDVGREGDFEYLAMERIDGQSLDQVMEQRGTLPWPEACRMIHHAALGLGAAHAQGIMHRDIKPANLMLDRAGVVKVMDFGLARLSEGTSKLSATGQVLGTPHYMSPEQARGDKLIDPRTDVFSLGSTLYFLLTGERPFSGQTVMAVIFNVVEQDPIAAEQVVPDLPPALGAILRKAMHKQRDQRYADGSAMAAALAPLLGDAGEGPAPTGPPAPGRRALLGVIGGGLALLAILLTLILTRARSDGSTAAAAAAHVQLSALLASAETSPGVKRDACDAFLRSHPDSPHQRDVETARARWQTELELLAELARMQQRAERIRRHTDLEAATQLHDALTTLALDARKAGSSVADSARAEATRLEQWITATTAARAPRIAGVLVDLETAVAAADPAAGEAALTRLRALPKAARKRLDAPGLRRLVRAVESYGLLLLTRGEGPELVAQLTPTVSSEPPLASAALLIALAHHRARQAPIARTRAAEAVAGGAPTTDDLLDALGLYDRLDRIGRRGQPGVDRPGWAAAEAEGRVTFIALDRGLPLRESLASADYALVRRMPDDQTFDQQLGAAAGLSVPALIQLVAQARLRAAGGRLSPSIADSLGRVLVQRLAHARASSGRQACSACAGRQSVACGRCDGRRTAFGECRTCKGSGKITIVGDPPPIRLGCHHCLQPPYGQAGTRYCTTCNDPPGKPGPGEPKPVFPPGKPDCKACHGTAKVPCECSKPSAPTTTTRTCTTCLGSGRVTVDCSTCRGAGRTPCGRCASTGQELDAHDALLLVVAHHVTGRPLGTWQAELRQRSKALVGDERAWLPWARARLVELGLRELAGSLPTR